MKRFTVTSFIVALGLVAVLLAPSLQGSTPPVVAQGDGEGAPDLSQLRVNTGGWATDFSKVDPDVDLTQFLGGGPGKDGIPAINDPVFESIESAREWIDGQAPVIALELNGEAKAYPMAVMTWHEIANDTIGGEPVVVTFCPLCNTALVFKATVDGALSDFGTSGNLYFSNLVMYDRQTESWWQQATGQAVIGEKVGTQLEFLPAQIVSLDQFATDHPEGTVLSRDTGFSREYGRNPYPGYDRADESPFLFSGTADGRIAPKERVATTGTGDQAIAFAYPELSGVGVATAEIDGEPIVVFWAPGTRSALGDRSINDSDDVGTTGIYSPVVNGRELTFVRDGDRSAPITDRETGSTWSVTGLATDGDLAGTQLERLVSADHLWFSWAAFNPDTRIWEPPLADGEEDLG